jgi:hypothetical protein
MARKKLKRKLDTSKKSKKSRRIDRSKRRFQSKGLQKRLKKSQDRAQSRMRSIIKGDIPLYQPNDGSHILDIIPYEAGKNDPIVEKGEPTYTLEIWVHPSVGPDNAVFLCPQRMYGDDCPICEDRQRMIDKGKDKDVYKVLYPKHRHIYNIVSYDRGEEKKGVQVWDVSYHYSEKWILALAERPTRGGKKKEINFPDEKEGQTISFTIEPAQSKDDYPSYVGWAFEDRDYEIDDDILDEAYCLDEIIHIADYDEIYNAYYGSKGKSKTKKGKEKEKEENEELEEALEELEDLEDMDELEDFIEEYDLEIKIKRRDDEETVKEKIEEALEEKFGEEEETEYTEKQINKMKKKQLKELIEEEELDIDDDEWDDIDELRELVIDELDL